MKRFKPEAAHKPASVIKAITRPAILLTAIMIGTFTTNTGARAEDLKNGEYMFTIAGCGSCHGEKGNPTKLTGGYHIKTEFGTFITPNISPDKEHGIGKWTKADFYAALKEGLSPRGNHYYPSFPYNSYAGMTQKDIFDIFSYIKSLPAIDVKSPDHELSFPYNLRNSIGLWKIAAALPDKFTPTVGESEAYNRGKYLVEHVAHCGECHTPRTSLFQTLDNTRRFEGSLLNGVNVPGITASKLKRRGVDAFIKSMTEGVTLRGRKMEDKGMLKVVENIKSLSKDDLSAVYAYLSGTEGIVTEYKVEPVALIEQTVVETKDLDNKKTSKVEEFFSKYCSSCHSASSGKEAARKDFTYTNLANLIKDQSLITPGDPDKSDIYLSVIDGTMPKHGERPTGEEVAALGQWIRGLKIDVAKKDVKKDTDKKPVEKEQDVADKGDAPEEETATEETDVDETDEEEVAEEKGEPHPFLDEEDINKAILNDLVNLSEFERRDTRYISHTHLYNAAPADASDQDLQANLNYYSLAIAKLINSVSFAPKLVKPVVVEGTNGTILRINIADLKWDDRKWHAIEKLYPYAVIADKGSALGQIQHITHAVAPVIRGDWLAFTASRAPLYNVLLHLPDTLGELERQLRIDANYNIDKGDVVRAAFTDGHSGVSDHNRLIERHDLPGGGYYWKSYDFGGSDKERSLIQHPFGPVGVKNLPDHAIPFVHDGGEVFFSLPNGLQAYYLADGKDKFIPSGPTEVVRDHTRPPGLGIEVVNAASCMSCHADGIIFKRDELREFAEKSSTFTVNQMKFLRELYPGKEKLREIYKEDQQRFTDALVKLGIGRRLEDGRFENISVFIKETGKTREIIGYLADHYQDAMTHQRVAAEFGLETEEFDKRIEAIPTKYAEALQEGLRIRNLLNNGIRLQRNQYEHIFPLMVAGLTGFDPAVHVITDKVAAYEEVKEKVEKKQVKVDYEPVTITKKDRKEHRDKRLTLVVKVPKNEFYFGETLSFSVKTTKTCELNIIYKQADGSIVPLPPELSGEAVLGNPILKAGETRHLPVSANVKLRFAPPEGHEELFVQCRAGGLKDYKVDEKKIKHIQEEYTDEYATRGLRIEIDKHAETERQVHDAVSIKFHVTKGH